MNDRQLEQNINFCNPADVAMVLRNEGAAMLAKVRLGEPIKGNDLAELLALVALGFAGMAQNNADVVKQMKAKQKAKSKIIRPVFTGN